MNTAVAIKSALTMEQVAEKYGYKPNRAGFIRCPFHAEKTASCKIYPGKRGFYCHACHEGGDIIRFTQLLFNLPFKDALSRLNTDFSLGLNLDKPDRAEISRLVRERQKEAQRREAMERRRIELFDMECQITAEMNRCEMAMADNPPTRDGWNATYPAAWVEAMKRRERLRAELYNNDCKQLEFIRQGG